MPSPIFICGYPKSGTTLLLSLLDQHPDLLVFPEETQFLRKAMQHPKTLQLQAGRKPVRQLLHDGDALLIDHVLSFGGIRRLQQEDSSGGLGKTDYSDFVWHAYRNEVIRRYQSSQRSTRDLLESVVLAYGAVTNQADKRYWVEKTPHTELFLHDALRLWSNLKGVYIIRDPRDVYVSYRNKRHSDGLDLPAETFTAAWQESLTTWQTFANAHPQQAHLVRYEDLVLDAATQIQTLCQFLGIEQSEHMLNPTRHGKDWAGNSVHDETFEVISSAPIGRYRNLLSPQEQSAIEQALIDVMSMFGWDVSS